MKEFTPKPDYATWTSYPYENGPIYYYGRIVTDGGIKTVWECTHKHLTREKAQECAEETLKIQRQL